MPKYFQDGNGRINCTKHIGHYATTALAKNSSAKTITTPITTWHLLDDKQIALTATFNPFICERCNSSTETQVDSLPVIEFPDSEDSKGLRVLLKTILADFPDIDEEFSDYCRQNTKFSYKQSTNIVAKEQWLAFVASKQVVIQPEPELKSATVEEAIASTQSPQEEIIIPLEEEVDDKILIRHQLVYNGQSVRDQKVRLQDRIDIDYDADGNPTGEDGYTRWLSTQPVERWLQSIRDEFEDSEYISNPIPFDKPLLIKVNWLPKFQYVATDTPTLNNKGELRVSKRQTLVIRGKAAQNSNSRKSSSPLDYNSQEQIDIYNQDLFYLPYIPSKSDGKYTMEGGQEIDVVRIEMVLGTEEVPNHLWSYCTIQSYDAATKTTTTHFSWTKAPRQNVKEKEVKQHPKRNGFEGFQAIMRDGGLSDPFTTQLYKLRPDGIPITQNGKSVIHETVVRFRIATAQLTYDKVENTKDGLRSTFKGSSDTAKGAQYNKSVDKTNRIWIDIYNNDGYWSGKPILFGNAHFASMEPIYDCVEVDSLVDNYKTTVRQRAKHILALIRKQEDKKREIQKACRNFSECNLVYQNDILYSVNGKNELKPMFRKSIKSYTPVVMIQHNGNDEDLKQLKQYDEIHTQCIKWLQKNHEKWLSLDIPQKKSNTKAKKDTYALSAGLTFIAKQTIRWGNPVFTDTQEKQPVTFPIIKELVVGAVLGELGDIKPEVWYAMRHQLLRLFVQLRVGTEYWEALSPLQQKDALRNTSVNFNVSKPSDLFNPANMGLAGTPPSATWFRLIEGFYKALGIGLIYTHYGDYKV